MYKLSSFKSTCSELKTATVLFSQGKERRKGNERGKRKERRGQRGNGREGEVKGKKGREKKRGE